MIDQISGELLDQFGPTELVDRIEQNIFLNNLSVCWLQKNNLEEKKPSSTIESKLLPPFFNSVQNHQS